MRYVRSQIYLGREQHRRLVQEAKRQGISLAELLRRIVDRHLPAAPSERREAYLSIVGVAEDPVTDVSLQHDRYLGEGLADAHRPR